MASNFDSIGLGVDNEGQLQELVVSLAGAAVERLATDAGEYAIWRSRTGAELWFHLGPAAETDGAEREILGVTPFFEGHSEVAVNVEEAIKRPGDNSHEGAFRGFVGAGAGDTGDGSPLIFDAIDFAAHCSRPLPAQWRVRLSGFARKAVVVNDGKAEEGEESAKSPRKSFCATGTSSARLSGRIAQFLALTSEVTGQDFYWLLVNSGAISFDIVASPDVIEGELAPGAVVQIDCVLFGRVLD